MDPLEVHLRYGAVNIDVFPQQDGTFVVIDFYGRELKFDRIELNQNTNFPSWLYVEGVKFCGVKINPNA